MEQRKASLEAMVKGDGGVEPAAEAKADDAEPHDYGEADDKEPDSEVRSAGTPYYQRRTACELHRCGRW